MGKVVTCLIPVFILLSCNGSSAPADTDGNGPGGPQRLEVVVSGLDNPVHLTAPAGDARLFIVEQPGRIRVFRNGRLLDEPFLDIVSRVGSGGERGLLSMAFHPRYAENGYFFVNYTDRAGDTQIERYRVSGDADRADGGSAKTILTIDQPYSNHNGGHILFGPDGMLYVGTGDGGGGGDPQGNGQNLQALLGKILRIDVDTGDPYAVPADNPFASGTGAQRREIWAVGLRNPWRMAFDDGVLYIADVGQNQWEEINVAPAGQGGLNYGWNIMEGAHCYRASSCDRSGLLEPALEYDHGDGCSVTGGLVYRGSRFPGLSGHYFYADYCEGWVRSFRYADGAVRDRREWGFGDHGQVLSFGADAEGELYVLTAGGDVLRME